ncbi:hypothetical protein C8R46DRAFT_1106701 [Mycena filopes]|nr:hypothetical protein C8R46DRAFT_1106701 [Mycena filopes]
MGRTTCTRVMLPERSNGRPVGEVRSCCGVRLRLPMFDVDTRARGSSPHSSPHFSRSLSYPDRRSPPFASDTERRRLAANTRWLSVCRSFVTPPLERRVWGGLPPPNLRSPLVVYTAHRRRMLYAVDRAPDPLRRRPQPSQWYTSMTDGKRRPSEGFGLMSAIVRNSRDSARPAQGRVRRLDCARVWRVHRLGGRVDIGVDATRRLLSIVIVSRVFIMPSLPPSSTSHHTHPIFPKGRNYSTRVELEAK